MSYIYNRIYIKIVQSGKDTLLGHPQAAGQHRKLQKIIRLESLTEQAADQRHHLSVVAVLKCLVQWYIIFINQQNGFPAIVFIE